MLIVILRFVFGPELNWNKPCSVPLKWVFKQPNRNGRIDCFKLLLVERHPGRFGQFWFIAMKMFRSGAEVCIFDPHKFRYCASVIYPDKSNFASGVVLTKKVKPNIKDHQVYPPVLGWCQCRSVWGQIVFVHLFSSSLHFSNPQMTTYTNSTPKGISKDERYCQDQDQVSKHSLFEANISP